MSPVRVRLGTLMIAVAVLGIVWGTLLALAGGGRFGTDGGRARVALFVVGALISWPPIQLMFRHDAYKQKAAHHAAQEARWLARWNVVRGDPPGTAPQDGPGPPAEAYLEHADWHARMRRKYRFAATYPWIVVPPDPDPPPALESEGDPHAARPVEEPSRLVATRLEHLGYERLIASLGMLHALVAGVVGLCLPNVLQGLRIRTIGFRILGGDDVAIVAACLTVAASQAALAIGLLRFHAWARWAEVALVAIALVFLVDHLAIRLAEGGPHDVRWPLTVHGAAGASLLPILALLLSAPASRIFSPAYREVALRTSHIRVGSGCLLPLMVLFGGVLLLAALIDR